MIHLALALLLLTKPAHADTKYCNGILTSNNVCIESESNVPPVIVRCDYPDSSDPRCVGVGRTNSRPVDPPRPKSRAPR
jgi:hypothetical protein